MAGTESVGKPKDTDQRTRRWQAHGDSPPTWGSCSAPPKITRPVFWALTALSNQPPACSLADTPSCHLSVDPRSFEGRVPCSSGFAACVPHGPVQLTAVTVTSLRFTPVEMQTFPPDRPSGKSGRDAIRPGPQPCGDLNPDPPAPSRPQEEAAQFAPLRSGRGAQGPRPTERRLVTRLSPRTEKLSFICP